MTSPALFRHDCLVNEEKFVFRTFKESQRVREFTCGIKDLDDFLTTKEVEKYEREGLGKTTLVFYKEDQPDLVGYFTISMEGLRIEYLKTWKSFTRISEMRVASIPAVKIGRLAVAKTWQNRGIGRTLIKYITGMALETQIDFGVRLLIVEAKKESVEFYRKCGFILTEEVKRERNKKHRTMFFDLQTLDDIA